MTQDAKQIENYRSVIKFLDNTVKNVGMYPANHPSVVAPIKRIFESLKEIFAHKDEVVIGIINGVLYINDYLFYEGTVSSNHILQMLEKFAVDDLVILKGASENEILDLAGILSSKGEDRDDFIKLLEEKQLTKIGLKSFSLGDADEGDLPVKGLKLYHDTVTTMTHLFGEVRSGHLPPWRETEAVVDGFMNQLAANRTLMILLSSLKGYDTYTYQHCVNVGILALVLGEAEGLDEQSIRLAGVAGMMHDVGKVKIPPEVLNKPGGLTLREWEAMKAHPVFSADVVRGMGGTEEVINAVGGHHMHYDGSGYPVQSEGSGQSNLAALVAVVDAYDAITTVRSYKKPMDPVEAMEYLRNGRGTRFKPSFVDSMIAMVGQYPPGTMVRLDSNEIGMVVETGQQPGKPVLRMIIDDNGNRFSETWDLALSRPDSRDRQVVSVADPAVYGLDPVLN